MSANRPALRPIPQPLRWVVSDVDGTIVTPDKQVTPATRAAAARLLRAGAGLTLASSRPPWGVRHVAAEIGVAGPIAGFNGAAIIDGEGRPLHMARIPEDAARATLAMFAAESISAWLFTDAHWLIHDPDGPHVAQERAVIRSDPTVAPDFSPWLPGACKIVGVSDDHERLASLASRLAACLRDRAHCALSQKYYLDVTPPGINKGSTVAWVAQNMGLPSASIMAIGDMDNDVPMLAAAGFAVAMGNGSAAAIAAADMVTAANDEDGFAAAVNAVLDAAGAS